MIFVYNLLIAAIWKLLLVIYKFHPKLNLFVQGREDTFPTLKHELKLKDKVIWVHAASLGEFEQGLPIIEKLKESYPNYTILLTFFSPSGFKIKKNTAAADIVTYLPWDTKSNVGLFLDLVQPRLVVFIKYDIWPNYLLILQERKIPAFLISARFYKKQIFFSWYGSFMRNVLSSFEHIYVQDKSSQTLLNTININNTTVAGDTRLDRVLSILDQDNTLGFMELFTKGQCIVAGSTWAEDEEVLIPYINNCILPVTFVIAPHEINEQHIAQLQAAITKKTTRYTKLGHSNLEATEVLIVDTIGLLTKIYSYATLSYVGGGFKTGLHNILEPAVFGIPVIIGPHYDNFIEAKELVQLGGVLPISDRENLREKLNGLLAATTLRNEIGSINKTYIIKSKGASTIILKGIASYL